jgi:hypothetical protein
MWNRISVGIAAMLATVVCGVAMAAAEYKIVTASEKGTYYAIGQDLSKHVAPAADINLEVLATSGSAANIKALRYDAGVSPLSGRCYRHSSIARRRRPKQPASSGRCGHPAAITPRSTTSRADSELNYLHDIKNAKINGGLVGSGAALITHTLYRMMFNGPIPEASASFLSNEEALVKLITDKSVDVVVVAAGQPAPLIANMKPEAQKFIKLLKFDPNHPASKPALAVYAPATVRAASYPNLLTADFTTISVGAFLVTYDYNLKGTVDYMGNCRCARTRHLQAEAAGNGKMEMANPRCRRWTATRRRRGN